MRVYENVWFFADPKELCLKSSVDAVAYQYTSFIVGVNDKYMRVSLN